MEVLLPQSGRGAGVLLVHPWWGLNSTVRDYGRSLSDQGFVVGLADAFEGTVVSSQAEAQALIERHWQAAPARLAAAFGELTRHPAVEGPTSGVGFSFGGFQLLGLLSALPLHRLVTYYADRTGDLAGVPVLGHFAETDPFADDQPGMIAKLSAAGAPCAAHVYPGTTHWFAERDRPEYDAEAAMLAFRRTVDFLGA